MKSSILPTLMTLLGLCVIFSIGSLALIRHEGYAGIIMMVFGLICLGALRMLEVRVIDAIPDMWFGVIDNGALVLFSLFGGALGGVAGAVVGGALGNALTDGLAGFVEGWHAERAPRGPKARTIATSSLGKMAGCFFGAGVALFLAAGFRFLGPWPY